MTSAAVSLSRRGYSARGTGCVGIKMAATAAGGGGIAGAIGASTTRGGTKKMIVKARVVAVGPIQPFRLSLACPGWGGLVSATSVTGGWVAPTALVSAGGEGVSKASSASSH